jgi:hypothetical protein
VKTPDRGDPAPSDVNVFFRLAALAVAVFIMTIFALVASLFGNPQAPLGRLLNQFGGALIAGEVVIILVVACLAMTVDRVRTLRRARRATEPTTEQAGPTPPAGTPREAS